jgi:hypothetical protein
MKPTSRAVMEEANTVGALGRDLAVFGTPNGAEARATLRQYAQVVVSDDRQHTAPRGRLRGTQSDNQMTAARSGLRPERCRVRNRTALPVFTN